MGVSVKCGHFFIGTPYRPRRGGALYILYLLYRSTRARSCLVCIYNLKICKSNQIPAVAYSRSPHPPIKRSLVPNHDWRSES